MRVAISGCGIAGPTLAYWLREYGHEPVLFESAPALRRGGYLIDFWGSGFEVASKMGLLPALRQDAYMVDLVQSVNARGKTTSSLGVGALADMLGGDYFSIARSDLAKHIFHACEGVETHFGCTIDQMEDDGAQVSLSLSDGRDEKFDLLVGADGLHSNVRQLAFGAQDQFERPIGLNIAAFVLDGYEPRDEGAYVQFTRPDLQISRIAMRENKTLILMVFADQLLANAPADEAAQKAALHKIFGNTGWEADAILAGMDTVKDVYFDRASQIEMPSWSKGRVVLIGDAAACPTLLAGEGTGLAMTEAYILAGELHRSGGNHEEAFAAYAGLLRESVAAKQKSALRMKGFFAPKSQFGVILRDVGMKLAAVPFLTKALLGAGLTSQIALPEYQK